MPAIILTFFYLKLFRESLDNTDFTTLFNPLFYPAFIPNVSSKVEMPQNHPHFWPKKPPFLPKFCTAKILHFALIFHADFSSHGNRIFWQFGERHATITQLFDPLNHIVTKSPNVVTTETVVTTFHPMGQNGIGAIVPKPFWHVGEIGCCAWTPPWLFLSHG